MWVSQPGKIRQQALGDAHVPVGLGAGGDLRRVVGPVLPDRVDGQQPTHQCEGAEHHEEEARRLGEVDREERVADHVPLGAAGPGPLRVLVVDDQEQVRCHERQQEPRDQQHVHDVEPRYGVGAGELPSEREEGQVAPHDRRGLDYPVRDPQPGARQQVVRQGVAREPLEDAEQQHRPADQPGDLAGLAERPGHEDPDQVDEHPGDEDHGGPVVDLPHQQPAAHVEADVQRRGVGIRHRNAAQLGVGALVGRLRHARREPQGQEHAGDQEHHEAPQGDLSQHERPVVREDLPQVPAGGPRQVQPVVGPARDLAQRAPFCHVTTFPRGMPSLPIQTPAGDGL